MSDNPKPSLTVAELATAFLAHAEQTWTVPYGCRASPRLSGVRIAFRVLDEAYGNLPAEKFTIKHLLDVRDRLAGLRLALRGARAGQRWSRTYVNETTRRIGQMFRWGAAQGLVSEDVAKPLFARRPRGRSGELDPLAPGTGLRETGPKPPPPAPDVIAAVVAAANLTIGAMIRFQLATEARPGEVCGMRVGDIDTSSLTWTYKPAAGGRRVLRLGPEARGIVRPFLSGDPDDFVFRPVEGVRRARRDAGLPDFKRLLRVPTRPRYSIHSYTSALRKVCRRTFPAPPDGAADPVRFAAWRARYWWTPGQLNKS